MNRDLETSNALKFQEKARNIGQPYTQREREQLSLSQAQPPTPEKALPNKEYPIVNASFRKRETKIKMNSPKRREKAGGISLGVKADDVAEVEEARRAQDFTHLEGRRASGQQKRLLEVNVGR